MRQRWLLLVLVLGAVLAAGCSRAVRPRPVDLERVNPALTSAPAGTLPVLRLAMAPLVSPAEMLTRYGPFYAYLQQRLGRPVELTQQRTYSETYDLLRTGGVDIALVCTYVYILGQKQIGLELLAAPVVNGRAEYYSVFIVRSDSPITETEELAGRSFAYSDPLSNSGRAYPVAYLRQLGADPGTFFAATTFTYSHDRSIRAVVDGLVDGAAVDSLVLDTWKQRNPDLAGRVRVIHRSPAFASPPFVASPRLPAPVRQQVQGVLLAMDADPEGQRVLASLGVQRFVAVTDADYASVRRIAEQAGMAP